MFVIIIFAIVGKSQALSCMSGNVENGNLTDFHSTPCDSDQTWCFSLHSLDKEKPTLDKKSCWNPDWENGVYNKFGCISGQHCMDGTCYEDATVCLCKYEDNCNDFINDGKNDTHSTPLPYPPSTPDGGQQCWYGVKENDTSSLDNKEFCRNQEQLCVRITDEEDNFEYRSCWESDFSIEYSRPGCYKGFSHCDRGVCHNETIICVCADNLCNDETYSSEAPPITPGSGLYCWNHEYDPHHHGHKDVILSGEDYVECTKDENFCIESTGEDTTDIIYRGCWSTDYEEGRYNFTGCEVGQHCMFGDCWNNTVCVCEGGLCNDFQLKENATTLAPHPVTTTNNTLLCWYGMQLNSSTYENWQAEICAPEETACMYLDGDNGFHLAGCYDFTYNNGDYNATGCYETGQHCWDNECHNGTLCICDDKAMCNNPVQPTSSPHPETPGSGLECFYGMVWGEGTDKQNLTKQECNKNETMCVAVYDTNSTDGHDFAYFSCHDPTDQSGHFNQSDVCVDDIYCWDDTHQHGPPGRSQDDPPFCVSGNVCTCGESLCNNYNASSTFSPGTPPTTQPTTMRCYFGEQHHSTGNETWKVEVCQENENHCFQIVSKTGFESRECWDLKYENEEYAGDGCYRGKHCHHEHCFDDVTACICSDPLCNDWTQGGNVTTDHPVTDGSGLLCYSGEFPTYQTAECLKNQTMCSYLLSDDGTEYVDCYDISKNSNSYYTQGCFENVDVDSHGHSVHGKFCICENDDLCNGDYFKNKPENGAKNVNLNLFIFSYVTFLYAIFNL